MSSPSISQSSGSADALPRRPEKAEWKQAVSRHTGSDFKRSVWQLVNTLAPLVALWVAMALTVRSHYWITLLLAVPASLLVVRSFIIFHDCGHGSFFKSTKANSIIGNLLGVLTFTPYNDWSREHALHHAKSGDLDNRGFGDIWTLTVKEYEAKSKRDQLRYRMYRSPLVIFLIGPIYNFVINQRFTRSYTGKAGRNSVYTMNVLLAIYVTGMSFALGGFKEFLMIQAPVTAFASIVGVWMFYVQHQFEDVYWEHNEDWDYTRASLEGSSFYKLPKLFQWFSGNIGFHHIHHLSHRIPNYKLEECYNSEPIFQEIVPLTFVKSLRLINFRLWDEETRTMVGWDYQPA
jgi:omega-6 fatty acid desaturase (delta-12 desaturase)